MIFAEQTELFPVIRPPGCLRFEIGTCLGPCTGQGTRRGYLERVQQAHQFLTGTCLDLLTQLEREMAEASAALLFERAAGLRDKLGVLHWLREHLDRLERAQRLSFVYPVRCHGGDIYWYLIRQGLVAAVLPVACDAEVRQRAQASVQKVYSIPPQAGRFLAVEEVDQALLVAAWFRRHPEERQRTLSPEQVLCRGLSPEGGV
jgi:excinuclease ABC subunit C